MNDAFVIGHSLTNGTSNSFLIGGTSQANIRAGSTICDLGTTANPFKDVYSNSGIIGTGALSMDNSGALTIAGTSAFCFYRTFSNYNNC